MFWPPRNVRLEQTALAARIVLAARTIHLDPKVLAVATVLAAGSTFPYSQKREFPYSRYVDSAYRTDYIEYMTNVALVIFFLLLLALVNTLWDLWYQSVGGNVTYVHLDAVKTSKRGTPVW